MTILKIITIALIFVGLAAAAVNQNTNMPPRDPCERNLTVLEACMKSSDCTLNAAELYRFTNLQAAMLELCPTD